MRQIKAQAGVWIGIIIFVFLIAGIVFALVIALQKGAFDSDEKLSGGETMKFYLRAMDGSTGKTVPATYLLIYNNSVLRSGDLGNDYTEMTLPKNISGFDILCWSKDYYSSKKFKIFNQQEMMNNISKSECTLDKIGDLDIKMSGDLDDTINPIAINVTANDNYRRLALCFSWTPGIIDVTMQSRNYVICESGVWLNWSTFDAVTSKYTYLGNDQYRCDNYIERCQEIQTNRCIPFKMEKPYRLLTTYDKCIYLGRTLKDSQSTVFVIEVKTSDYKNQLDKLTINFIDTDLRFNLNTLKYEFVNEIDGKDIGSKDMIREIDYSF